jgi:hypothetical protein
VGDAGEGHRRRGPVAAVDADARGALEVEGTGDQDDAAISRGGTFSPSRRLADGSCIRLRPERPNLQMRSTRLSFTSQPALRSKAVSLR